MKYNRLGINCMLYVYTNVFHTATHYNKTRNAWQSLVYSPLGTVVSAPSKYL